MKQSALQGLWLVLVSALLSIGCGDDPVIYVAASDRAPDHVVRGVWVEEHPLLPKEVVFRGINRWSVIGLEVFETTKEEADMTVASIETGCEPRVPNGPFEAGISGEEDDQFFVRIHTDCLPGTNTGKALEFIVAHETGHNIGAWHVPSSCDGSDKENQILHDKDGTSICGELSVMNPPHAHFALKGSSVMEDPFSHGVGRHLPSAAAFCYRQS